jgi:Ca-activated chloride channel family protein
MSIRRMISLLTLVALAAGCRDSAGPDDPEIAALTVSGVRVDATRFRADGSFELGLLALDDDGRSILSERAEAEAAITQIGSGSGAGYSIAFRGISALAPSDDPISAAILLDDSGSMASNDPSTLRADAAALFWTTVLGSDSRNQAALLDFGAGGTAGFGNTRLLQRWTRNTGLLEDGLAAVGDYGGTPLYESIRETVVWVDSTAAPSSNRVMLVLTDGLPNSFTSRSAALAAAQNARITIHTVGLGPASDAGSFPDGAAVAAVREIAERTGGVYSSATDADALAPIFEVLAQVSSEGQLIGAFSVSPVPASGTRVQGTVTVRSGGRSSSATWSFVAP